MLFHEAEKSPLSESVQLSKEDLIGVRNKQGNTVKDLKDTRNVRDTETVKEVYTTEQPVREKSISSGTASMRSDAILQTLRSHGELGIREIASNLPEYSEKMIQRELVEMVLIGKVKKTGSKRWSRYSATS